MSKIIIITVSIVVAVAGLYFLAHRPLGEPSEPLTVPATSPTNSVAPDAGPGGASLPRAELVTIVSIYTGNALTVRHQDGTTSDILIAPTTLIYEDGAPISSVALAAGETVAVILFPPAVGASNVAQSITVTTVVH